MVFEYIWLNHLSINNEGCVFMETKTSNDNIKSNNHNSECLYVMLANHRICVVLQSIVCHVDSWNRPKLI